MNRTLMLLAASFVLSSAPAIAGTIVYENLSAGSGATSGGDAGTNAVGGGPLADSFSTGAGISFLSDVKLNLRALTPGDGGSILVSLYSNSSNTPGSLIAALMMIPDSTLTSSLSVVDIPIIASLSLSASTRYWIELSGSGSGRWSFDNTNVGTGVANEYNYYAGSAFANSNFTPYQMTVTTNSAIVATPEPSALSLTGLGFAGLALLRRRIARMLPVRRG